MTSKISSWEPDDPGFIKCGAIRTPDSDRSPVCELPRGHDGTHFGRSYAGRWFDWERQDEQ